MLWAVVTPDGDGRERPADHAAACDNNVAGRLRRRLGQLGARRSTRDRSRQSDGCPGEHRRKKAGNGLREGRAACAGPGLVTS
jgi:hypothetical protein